MLTTSYVSNYGPIMATTNPAYEYTDAKWNQWNQTAGLLQEKFTASHSTDLLFTHAVYCC